MRKINSVLLNVVFKLSQNNYAMKYFLVSLNYTHMGKKMPKVWQVDLTVFYAGYVTKVFSIGGGAKIPPIYSHF